MRKVEASAREETPILPADHKSSSFEQRLYLHRSARTQAEIRSQRFQISRRVAMNASCQVKLSQAHSSCVRTLTTSGWNMQMARFWTICSSASSTALPISAVILRGFSSCNLAAASHLITLLSRCCTTQTTSCQAQHHGGRHKLLPNEAGARAKIADARIR